ncbi:hypothetical protein PCE1_002844 [Barthelona sp. PCE]
MVIIYKNDDGCAYTRQLDPETNKFKHIVLSTEEFTGQYWSSKDGKTIATVHLTCICVFDVRTLERLWRINTKEKISYGCLSIDGLILSFRAGNKYRSIDLKSGNIISSIDFSSGRNCWVNSQFIFIQKRTQIHIYSHENKRVAYFIKGDVLVQGFNGETYVIHNYYVNNRLKILLVDAEGSILPTFETDALKSVKYGDISEKYLAVGNHSIFQVYNRKTREVVKCNISTKRINSIHISPDQEHVLYSQENEWEVSNIRSPLPITSVLKEFMEPTTKFTVLGEDLMLLNNLGNSYFYYMGNIISYVQNHMIHPVKNGYLLFFPAKVYYLDYYMKKSETKLYKCHQGIIAKVEEITTSIFKVCFYDGTNIIMEWNYTDGFGRSAIWQEGSIPLDSNVCINNLLFELADQRQMYKFYLHELFKLESLSDEYVLQLL